MAAVDFTNALARLLHDGALRNRFAAAPEVVAAQLQLEGNERTALLALNQADLEYQAEVLLRKRLDAIKEILPGTCQNLGGTLWPSFLRYARCFWPAEEPVSLNDSRAFCIYLLKEQPSALFETENNRVRFLLSTQRVAIHIVNRGHPGKGKALQLLWKTKRQRSRELMFYLRL